MKILLVAATEKEVETLKSHSDFLENEHVDILITGVGMVATAYRLGAHLSQHPYKLALNMGICGSFDEKLELGQVVNVVEDRLAELGAEDKEKWLTLEDIEIGTKKDYIFRASAKLDIPVLNDLKKVKAITVNRVHGNRQSIEKMKKEMDPQVESMEGAAFFYACREAGVPAIQVRAVSNYVEERNKENWQLRRAVQMLTSTVKEIINELKTHE